MDEDLVVQAMRSVFSVRQAFSEQLFNREGLPVRQDVETPTGKIYVGGYYGSAFCFNEDGLLVTCEHVRQDTHKQNGGHEPAFVVVCPYRGGGAELDWQHSWRAEFVAHTGIEDPNYQNLVPEVPPLPPGMILPDKIDLAILRLVEPVAATPLAKPPPLRFSRIAPVAKQECWVLGYPPAGGTTPTLVPMTCSFTHGNALKVIGAMLKVDGRGAMTMPGHSGGPLVTTSGTVIGWNFRRNSELSHSQMIAAAEKCIRLVLTAPDAWDKLFASSEAESAHDRQQQGALNAQLNAQLAASLRSAAEHLDGGSTRPMVASSSHSPTESPNQEPPDQELQRRAGSRHTARSNPNPNPSPSLRLSVGRQVPGAPRALTLDPLRTPPRTLTLTLTAALASPSNMSSKLPRIEVNLERFPEFAAWYEATRIEELPSGEVKVLLLSMKSDSALTIDGRTEYIVPANKIRPVPEPLQGIAVFDDVIDSKTLVPSKALTDAANQCEFQFDDGWWRVAVQGSKFRRSRLEVVYQGFGPAMEISHTTKLSKLRPIVEYNSGLRRFLPVKLGLLSSSLQGMGEEREESRRIKQKASQQRKVDWAEQREKEQAESARIKIEVSQQREKAREESARIKQEASQQREKEWAERREKERAERRETKEVEKKQAADKLEEAIESSDPEKLKEAIRVAKAAKVDPALIVKAEAERKNRAKRQKTEQPAPGRPAKRERSDDSAGSSASDAKRQAGPRAGTAQAAAPAVEPAASPAGEPAVSPSAATPAATLAAPPAGPVVESFNPVVEMNEVETAAAVAPSAEEPTEPPATSDE